MSRRRAFEVLLTPINMSRRKNIPAIIITLHSRFFFIIRMYQQRLIVYTSKQIPLNFWQLRRRKTQKVFSRGKINILIYLARVAREKYILPLKSSPNNYYNTFLQPLQALDSRIKVSTHCPEDKKELRKKVQTKVLRKGHDPQH